MSRRIQTGKAGSLARGALKLGTTQSDGEDYLGRVAKYIPAEIVGLYLATSGMVPLDASTGQPRRLALWIVFFLNFAFVPLYFWFATTRDNQKPLIPQIILASIAFPVWVFAIGGPFRSFPWYEGWIASLTLAFVTVAMGFCKPAPGS